MPVVVAPCVAKGISAVKDRRGRAGSLQRDGLHAKVQRGADVVGSWADDNCVAIGRVVNCILDRYIC